MQRARIGVIAAAILAVATVAFAQKPDFSGTWTPEPPAGGGGGGGGRGGGGPMTVTQKGDTLTIERTMGDNKVTQTYDLSGKETTNQQMGRGGGAPVEAKSTTKWDGTKLVITTKAGENETTQTWSMEGGNLVIERTTGRGPQKTTYKKST